MGGGGQPVEEARNWKRRSATDGEKFEAQEGEGIKPRGRSSGQAGAATAAAEL